MFDRPGGGELALLVHCRFLQSVQDSPAAVSFSDARQEFTELCLSAGCAIADYVTAQRRAPHSKYFIGPGKAEEIRQQVEAQHVDLVIFNHNLSPAQERNLEKLFQCRVLARTGLILDIFAQRARSFEGKLQVELAQLRHLSTRLIRGWTHLERQKGGIGLRGPGETQLETDRRLIGHRIKKLASRLEKVRSRREQGRRSRQKANIPGVALVGYTNAGKSTLFNMLTRGQVYAVNQLFATLDPTLRRLDLDGGSHAVLADTVGFIRDLPHDLVAAFHSTLAETRDADLLLHVVDASREDRDECIGEVEKVLKQIDADRQPALIIYNKVDLTQRAAGVEYDQDNMPVAAWVSAHTGAGIDELRQALMKIFRQQQQQHGWIMLDSHEAAMRSELYRRNVVLLETSDDQGRMLLEINICQRDLQETGLQERFSNVQQSAGSVQATS